MIGLLHDWLIDRGFTVDAHSHGLVVNWWGKPDKKPVALIILSDDNITVRRYDGMADLMVRHGDQGMPWIVKGWRHDISEGTLSDPNFDIEVFFREIISVAQKV